MAEIRALVEEYRRETPGEYQRAVARSIEDRAEHDVPWLVDRITALEALLAAQRPDYSIVHAITTPDAPERPAL